MDPDKRKNWGQPTQNMETLPERYQWQQGNVQEEVARKKTIQKDLINAGHSLPRYGVDGILGKETERAVMEFQKANGLKVDGILGVETLTALQAAGVKNNMVQQQNAKQFTEKGVLQKKEIPASLYMKGDIPVIKIKNEDFENNTITSMPAYRLGDHKTIDSLFKVQDEKAYENFRPFPENQPFTSSQPVSILRSRRKVGTGWENAEKTNKFIEIYRSMMRYPANINALAPPTLIEDYSDYLTVKRTGIKQIPLLREQPEEIALDLKEWVDAKKGRAVVQIKGKQYILGPTGKDAAKQYLEVKRKEGKKATLIYLHNSTETKKYHHGKVTTNYYWDTTENQLKQTRYGDKKNKELKKQKQ